MSLLEDATTSLSSSVCRAQKVQCQVNKDKCQEAKNVLSYTCYFSQWTWIGNYTKEIVLSRLTTPAAAANDPVCTTLLMTFSTLDQKFRNTESHFTISVLMTKVNHSSINSLFFCWKGKVAKEASDFIFPNCEILEWSIYSEFGI